MNPPMNEPNHMSTGHAGLYGGVPSRHLLRECSSHDGSRTAPLFRYRHQGPMRGNAPTFPCCGAIRLRAADDPRMSAVDAIIMSATAQKSALVRRSLRFVGTRGPPLNAEELWEIESAKYR